MSASSPSLNRWFPAAARLGALSLVFLALFAAPAFAQSDPTAAQYDDSVTQVAGDGGSGSAPTPSSSPAPQPALEQNIVQGLPITGLDVVALAAVALALTAMGFALRRLTAIDDDLS